MTRAAIVSVAISETGYNLTDSAAFATMGTGAGNGVSFTYSAASIIVLKNTTAGAAVYTFKVPAATAYSAKGVTLPDVTVTLAAGKSWLYRPSGIFKQSDDKVYVDCDVAGSILVMSL